MKFKSFNCDSIQPKVQLVNPELEDDFGFNNKWNNHINNQNEPYVSNFNKDSESNTDKLNATWEVFSDDERKKSIKKSKKKEKLDSKIKKGKVDKKFKLLENSNKIGKFNSVSHDLIKETIIEKLESHTIKKNQKKELINSIINEEFKIDQKNTENINNFKQSKTTSKGNYQMREDKLPQCFACREIGHSIKYCTKIKNDARNICLKCGDQNHSYKNCPIHKGPVYNFATCFICKKMGHITSQCKEKTNGIYPDGGSCRSCKSVDHFIADCPKLKTKKKNFKKNKFNKYKQTKGKKN